MDLFNYYFIPFNSFLGFSLFYGFIQLLFYSDVTGKFQFLLRIFFVLLISPPGFLPYSLSLFILIINFSL